MLLADVEHFFSGCALKWTVVEQFGPTASGLEGFTAIIPEMDSTSSERDRTSMHLTKTLRRNCHRFQGYL